MPKVTLHGHIIIPEQELAQVVEALELHTQLTRQELGCITFNVTQDSLQANKYEVYEEFTDESAFEKHQQRVKNSVWGRVSSNVERHYQVTYSN